MRRNRWGAVHRGMWHALAPVAVWTLIASPQVLIAEEPVQQATLVQPLPATEPLPGSRDDELAQARKRIRPVLNYARQTLKYVDNTVRDYECMLVRRERIDGVLSGYQHLQMKIRHEQQHDDQARIPFAVYLKFLGPARYQGREVLFVHGENDGSMIARRGGSQLANMTLKLNPEGSLAMQSNRYPVTEVGLRNLIVKLIEVMENDHGLEGCEVRFFKNSKINSRPCTHIQVSYPQQREGLRFQRADVYIDHKLKLPICFASYYWPNKPGEDPQLLEEYVYSDLQLNVGLTDEDFNPRNPAYRFQLSDSDAGREPQPSPTKE